MKLQPHTASQINKESRIDNWCSLIESTLDRTQGENKETIRMGDMNINFVNGVVTIEKGRGVVDAFQLKQVIISPIQQQLLH